MSSKGDRRNAFDQTSTFYAADGGGPFVEGKGIGDPFRQSVSRIAPAIFRGVPVNVLLKLNVVGRNAPREPLRFNHDLARAVLDHVA